MADAVTIEQKVKEAIAGCLVERHADEIRKDHHLVDDLGLDSLDIVTLEVDLEERFGIRFEEGDIEKQSTVDHLVGYVMEHMTGDPWHEAQLG